MTKRHIIIATRESPLALRQANLIKALLLSFYPHLGVELLGITTVADERLDISLIDIGGKGLFVKELEEALLARTADIAVHSMKDVPMTLPPGLCLPTIIERDDPRDVFISNQYTSLAQLPRGASVGTASIRRQTQLLHLRSDLTIQGLRGNVNTRLKRLDDGDFAAIILASAGLKRLHLTSRIRSYLSTEQCLPAAGQGALGIECRDDDEGIKKIIAPLNHLLTNQCVTAERALCRALGGGCKLPIAAYAQIQQGSLRLRGLVANRNGTLLLRVTELGDPKNADDIGTRAADVLIQQGAQKILAEF